MLQAGDTLAGYRIESVAGVGGMGVVYKATQMSLERPVALKVLSSTLVGNRAFRERFRREGRHAAALDHPNIIPVYEAGESNGLMFIAMRLVDGPSLAELIANDRLSGREALRVVGAIASALDAAHEAGLVHRDIKPQNILLTRTGHPYLADFGITKGTDHAGLTHSGDFVGSLNYVAPEQIDGGDVTAASDVYSLTAVLFESLSGLAPYQRDTDAALMLAHLQAPPPTLAERGIEAPASVDRVFETGMAKLAATRYTSAGALVEACRTALQDAGSVPLVRTPAFPPPEPPTRPAQPPQAESAAAPPEPPAPPTAPAPPKRPAPAPAGFDSMALTIEPAPAVPDPAADARRGATGTPAPAREVPPLNDTPDEARGRRSIPLAAVAALALVLLVGAVIAGLQLGRKEPAASPARATSRALTLIYDATWSRSPAAIEGLELEQPVSLRRANGLKLVAGRLATFDPGFDPVPRALRARFAAAGEPVTVRLGSRLAVRHAVELRSRERLWLALVPDDKGWLAVACEGPGADGPSACPAIAGTIDVLSAKGVRPGPDGAVAAAMSAALAELNAVRASTKRALRSRKALIRARAARSVAGAHRTAAGKVAAAGARPQEAALVKQLGDGLLAQAGNFTNLANAAQRRRVARYDSARDTIRRRERRLRATLDALADIGYRA